VRIIEYRVGDVQTMDRTVLRIEKGDYFGVL